MPNPPTPVNKALLREMLPFVKEGRPQEKHWCLYAFEPKIMITVRLATEKDWRRRTRSRKKAVAS